MTPQHRSDSPVDQKPPPAQDDVVTEETEAENEETAKAAKRAKAEKIGRYVAMFVMPLLMVGMMVWGYLFAMHNPTPHHLPIAVTGQQSQAVEKALDSIEDDAVETSSVADEAEAKQQVLDREVAGAVVVQERKATLYTAGAAGATQAQVVSKLVTPVATGMKLHVEPKDLNPLPASDPAGLGAMFMATSLVLAGYLPLSITLTNAPQLLLLKRRAFPLLAGWSALIAGIVWLVTGPVLDIVPAAKAWPVLGIAWLGVFAVGAVQLFFTRLVGPLAVMVGMFLLMVLGIPSSNMSISMYTAPPFYTFLHSFLPTPAIGESLRAVLYFDGDGVGSHLLVLGIGAVAALALIFVVDAIKRKDDKHLVPVVINMPSLHGGPRPKSRFWQYATLLFFPVAMVTLMISAMLSAMHAPQPRDMPVAVVSADHGQAEKTIAGIEKNMDGMFDLSVIEDEHEAREKVEDRDLAGAFVLPTAQDEPAVVVTNQAGGNSTAQTVTSTFTQVAQGSKMKVDHQDVAPLPQRDSMGTVPLYLSIGWIMAGFMIIVVGANAAPASRPLPKLLPIVAFYSVFMSTVVWLIAAVFVGAVHGHWWQLLGTGAIAIFCVAMFATVLERLLGMLAVLPIVGVMMFLGIPSSGGALSVYMEPVLFQGLHGVLPMSAGVEAARSVLYFDSDTLGSCLLTFAAWGAVSLFLVAVIDRFKTVRTKVPVHTEDVFDSRRKLAETPDDDAEVLGKHALT